MEDRKARIKFFLSKWFRDYQLRDDEDIFALGFVNSLLAIQLLAFLEREFGVTIEDQDLDFDNFRTLNGMDALLHRKTNVVRSPG
ncbi:MAG TPA: acyl carrier protein [Vicinamibacterales bacterium]|nr:acyl carrier protein [Vicinamibacterales bacterium]